MSTKALPPYESPQPEARDVRRWSGPVVLEFGANWCGICQGFEPTAARLLARFPQVRHVRVADGPGEPLGRHFRVKLWPNFVALRDGESVGQLARPSEHDLQDLLEQLVEERT